MQLQYTHICVHLFRIRRSYIALWRSVARFAFLVRVYSYWRDIHTRDIALIKIKPFTICSFFVYFCRAQHFSLVVPINRSTCDVFLALFPLSLSLFFLSPYSSYRAFFPLFYPSFCVYKSLNKNSSIASIQIGNGQSVSICH